LKHLLQKHKILAKILNCTTNSNHVYRQSFRNFLHYPSHKATSDFKVLKRKNDEECQSSCDFKKKDIENTSLNLYLETHLQNLNESSKKVISYTSHPNLQTVVEELSNREIELILKDLSEVLSDIDVKLKDKILNKLQ